MSDVLFVCGSLRQHSWNRQLLDVMADRWSLASAAGSDPSGIDHLDLRDVHLPLQNADLEDDPVLMDAVLTLHARFAQARAVVIASPEHNGQVSAGLKNLVDWVSRVAYLDASVHNPFLNQPTLLVSATPGWSDGVLGLQSLRALMAYVGSLVLAQTVTVPHVHEHAVGPSLELPPATLACVDDALTQLWNRSRA